MNTTENILITWDAITHGKNILLNAINSFENKEIKLSTILYLTCEYIFEDNELLDDNNQNAKERIQSLENYYKDSSIKFTPLVIPSSVLEKGKADDLKVLENSLQNFVFPIIKKLNPNELHISLTSGTQTMRFAWISLFSKSIFTRSFGRNIHLWQKVDDRGIKKQSVRFELYEIEIDKNPFIDSIEFNTFKSNKPNFVDLDLDEKIKRNAAVDVPMLILGERGIGKSCLIESTIVPIKQTKGYIDKTEVTTIICGQLSSTLAEDELFGHEKGAFTGADAQKKGKIELANKGILFLDEIQDLPQPVQRQLLRALQEKKVRRIGSNDKEIKSDFRLVCASNKSLAELQTKLDPDFFDRIATFKSYIKPLREQSETKLKELWENRWENSVYNGFMLPEQPDNFNFVKDTLIKSKMQGNIRDIEQLIAYIARDVYQGTTIITDNVKTQRYKEVLKEWIKDYNDRYFSSNIEATENYNCDSLEDVNSNILEDFMENYSWKTINNLFKKWLANTAIEQFGSRKEAAKALRCEEKTLYNAKIGE